MSVIELKIEDMSQICIGKEFVITYPKIIDKNNSNFV